MLVSKTDALLAVWQTSYLQILKYISKNYVRRVAQMFIVSFSAENFRKVSQSIYNSNNTIKNVDNMVKIS
jgi:hypothetical protein